MSMQDPISDLITRIKNSQLAGHTSVKMPSSKKKLAILAVLKSEGYIDSYEVKTDGAKSEVNVSLKYFAGKPVIDEFTRVSKPSLRKFADKDSIPSVNGGLGVAVISTSKGLLTDKEARSQGVGGEVICYVA